MGGITFSGIGSGIDIDSLVGALLDAERRPTQLRLDRQEADLQITQTGLQGLNDALSELRTAVQSLDTLTDFQRRTTTSSDGEVATISANESASTGSYAIEVTQLAQGTRAETAAFAGGTSATPGTGTLRFTAGDSSFSVDVSAGDDLLTIRNAINAATGNFGVTANIINTTNGAVLVYTSDVTGDSNQLQVSTDNTDLDQLTVGNRLQTTNTFADPSADLAATGSLSFAAGTDNFTVLVNNGDSLETVRDTINSNANNFGIRAEIVDDAGDNRLVFTGQSVGDATNPLTVTSFDASLDQFSTSGAGLTQVNNGATISEDAQGAEITIDGLTVQSDTNVFTDAVQDTTITLADTAELNDTATLSVALDTRGVQASIEGFVETYNAYVEVIETLTRAGGEGEASGILIGDATARTVVSQIRSELGRSVLDSGAVRTLSDLGITTTQTGRLEISTADGQLSLSEVIEQNFEEIGDFFADTQDGLANRLDDILNQYVGFGGVLDQRDESIDNQLSTLADQREALTLRLLDVEARLRRQFGALDALVAANNNTQQFLAAQLSSLPSISNNNNN